MAEGLVQEIDVAVEKNTPSCHRSEGVWRFGDEVQYGNDRIAVLIQEQLDFTFASAQHHGPLRCGQEHRHDYRESHCAFTDLHMI